VAALAGGGLPHGAVLKDLGTHRLKDLGQPERLFQLSGPGLAAEFPPLRTQGNPELPNNLPAQPTAQASVWETAATPASSPFSPVGGGDVIVQAALRRGRRRR
jgi:hypothetical protein